MNSYDAGLKTDVAILDFSKAFDTLPLTLQEKSKKIQMFVITIGYTCLPLLCLHFCNICIWPSVLLIFSLCLIRKLQSIKINISCFSLDILCVVVTFKLGMLKGSDYKTWLDIYFCRKYRVCISCKQTRMQECRQWLQLVESTN